MVHPERHAQGEESVEEWASGAKRVLFTNLFVVSFLALYTSCSLVTSLLLASFFLVPLLLSKGTVLFRLVMDKVPFVRRLFWKKWYNFISDNQATEQVRFMNYGFDSSDGEFDLADLAADPNKYSAQLYYFVATGAMKVDLRNRRVLEIGCGRGGGCNFIQSRLKPKEVVGLDFSSENIAKANEQFKGNPKLTFKQGDAEDLPFEDGEFDVVINVESSHCYGNVEKFFSEVQRVLRPGGDFLFVDLRGASKLEDLQALVEDFDKEGKLVKRDELDITPNVVRALELSSPRKEEFINTKITGVFSFLRFILREFMAIKGSEVFNAFVERRMMYQYYRLQKCADDAVSGASSSSARASSSSSSGAASAPAPAPAPAGLPYVGSDAEEEDEEEVAEGSAPSPADADAQEDLAEKEP